MIAGQHLTPLLCLTPLSNVYTVNPEAMSSTTHYYEGDIFLRPSACLPYVDPQFSQCFFNSHLSLHRMSLACSVQLTSLFTACFLVDAGHWDWRRGMHASGKRHCF